MSNNEGAGGRLIAGNIDNSIRTVWLRVDFECSDRYSVQPVLSAVLEIESVLFLLNNEKGKDRKSTRLNSSHSDLSRMPSSA